MCNRCELVGTLPSFRVTLSGFGNCASGCGDCCTNLDGTYDFTIGTGCSGGITDTAFCISGTNRTFTLDFLIEQDIAGPPAQNRITVRIKISYGLGGNYEVWYRVAGLTHPIPCHALNENLAFFADVSTVAANARCNHSSATVNVAAI